GVHGGGGDLPVVVGAAGRFEGLPGGDRLGIGAGRRRPVYGVRVAVDVGLDPDDLILGLIAVGTVLNEGVDARHDGLRRAGAARQRAGEDGPWRAVPFGPEERAAHHAG